MKRKFASGLAFTVVALLGLVPIQASPASAFAGTLDVTVNGGQTLETAVRPTRTIQRLTATVSPAAVATINFDDNANSATVEQTCDTTVAVPTCYVALAPLTAPGDKLVRAWVTDGPIPPCVTGSPVPGGDCDGTEGQDETATPGADPGADDTDVVLVAYAEASLDVVETPAPAFPPSATVNLTATVKSTEATPRALIANIDAEILSGQTPESPNKDKNTAGPDAQCNTTPATGVCTLSYLAGPTTGVDIVRAWIDENSDPGASPMTGDETAITSPGFEGDKGEGANEASTPGDTPESPPDRTDVVAVNISAGQVLTVSQKTNTKTTGTPVTVTASVTFNGTPQNNINVAAAVLTGGPNAGKVVICSTGSGGTCALTYTGGSTAGVDKFRATVDTDGNGQPNEADSSETDVSTIGGTLEPDTTDVAQITWQAPTPTPTPTPDEDNSKCEQAKRNLAKAKKALKKAKAHGDAQDISRAKKRVKRTRSKKRAACA